MAAGSELSDMLNKKIYTNRIYDQFLVESLFLVGLNEWKIEFIVKQQESSYNSRHIQV